MTDRINKSEAGRFPRWIDATLIEHQIDFLYNEKLYKEHFKPYFEDLFPAGFASASLPDSVLRSSEYQFLRGDCWE